MNDMPEFSTPMMQQYAEIKKQYADCLLFFRLGDFYEMFLDDAKIAAEVLDIALTSRDRGQDGRIPMAGVPFHAVNSYLPRLVKAGYKVAICEQVSEPSAKGLVDREVIRVVTPGTLLDESSLEKRANNFIVSISLGTAYFGMAFADISTGVFYADEFPVTCIKEALANELAKFSPAECILPRSLYENVSFLKQLSEHKTLNIFPYADWEVFSASPHKHLKEHFKLATLTTFDLENKSQAQEAASALLGYLKQTQKSKAGHITSIRSFKKVAYLELDRSTIMNLELFTTLRTGERRGSLLTTLDETCTAMGARMLKNMLLHPLTDKALIAQRHEAVDILVHNLPLRETLREELRKLTDVERLLSRLSVGVGTARDLVSLRYALETTLAIRTHLPESTELLTKIRKAIAKELSAVTKLIDTFIVEEPPLDPKKGGLVKGGINADLDELRSTVSGSQHWVITMETLERENTGIPSLKVKYNQVFGYYIEVTKANLHLVPEHYIRKQTLVNAERFITPELKKHEEIILTAKEKIEELEYAIFLDVVDKVLEYTSQIQQMAENVALLDCLACFAYLAQRNNYVKPHITTTGYIELKESRHPVVEQCLEDSQFVPNDILLNQQDHQLLIITGPNMAGKSVFIRQVALIVLMAQMGSFVPAISASISLVDKLFVRSGASDVIASGLSTFMTEMVETAYILNNATDRSLIIMDEIGRGTSTFDGISIAQATAEYLVTNKHISPKTLFATHYHELQALEEQYPTKIKNYQVLAHEQDGGPVFLHKVVRGAADHSYGIAVAKLAGVPEAVTTRALQVLNELEIRDIDKKPSDSNNSDKSLSDDLRDIIVTLDLENLTSLEALNLLWELKRRCQRQLDCEAVDAVE